MTRLLWILSVAFSCISGTAKAQTYRYGPEVALYGTLVLASGETPDGDKLTYPAIDLAVPITVEATRGEEAFEPTEKGVKLLHLVLDEREMNAFRSMNGQRVVVSGTLFHADNGNHQTNVLVDVTSITKSR